MEGSQGRPNESRQKSERRPRRESQVQFLLRNKSFLMKGDLDNSSLSVCGIRKQAEKDLLPASEMGLVDKKGPAAAREQQKLFRVSEVNPAD